MKKNIFFTIFALILGLFLILPASGNDVGHDNNKAWINHARIKHGVVFVMTNAAEGNEIVMYRRTANGKLRYMDQFPTGGIGSDVGKTIPIDPLGSQNSLIINETGDYLYAVNAGDDSVTVFAIQEGYLKFLDNAPSGGRFPVSLTVHDDILYVLNAGANDSTGGETPSNITGFSLAGSRLMPLAGSTRELINVPQNPTDPGSDFPNILATPAQIQFTPGGDQLIVTVKDGLNVVNSSIRVYEVNSATHLPEDTPFIFNTAGPVPFGFTFDSPGHLIVTDAGVSTVTVYNLENGGVETIGVPAETGQAATCWIAAAGPYVYAANTGSGTLTGYRVSLQGKLTEIGRFSVGDGALNIDLAVSRDGKFLYTQNGGFGTLSIFRILHNGKLVSVGGIDVTEPVSGFQGIAAW